MGWKRQIKPGQGGWIYITALFTRGLSQTRESQLTFFSATNHLSRPLRKQNSTYTSSKANGLWSVISEFRSVLWVFVACDRNYDWRQRKTQLWRRLLNFRVRVFVKRAVNQFSRPVWQSVADLGEGPAPSFLDQTESRRAEIDFFGDRPPPLSQGLDDRAPGPLIWRSGSATDNNTYITLSQNGREHKGFVLESRK